MPSFTRESGGTLHVAVMGVNWIGREETNHALISRLFDRLVDNESEFARHFYMDEQKLAEMHSIKGFSVGGHGYTHRPLATLSAHAVNREVTLVKEKLDSILHKPAIAFSYPHGSVSAVGHREASAVRNAGYKFAFTMERALNGSLRQPHLLSRIDCIELPGSKRPLFDYSGAVPTTYHGQSPVFRSRYLSAVDAPA